MRARHLKTLRAKKRAAMLKAQNEREISNRGYKAGFILLVLLLVFVAFPGWLFQEKMSAEAKADALEDIVIRQSETIRSKDTELDNLRKQNATKTDVDNKINTATPIKAYTMQKAREAFGDVHMDAFEKLINSESGFNLFALNKSSGACGMFQALPCSKLPGFDLESQVSWGLKYISDRYGTPTEAWKFHLAKNWY